MSSTFNFSFVYPVTQAKSDKTRRRGIEFIHITDLLISGTARLDDEALKLCIPRKYNFELASVMADEENIFPLLENSKALKGIHAACEHHLQQHSFTKKGYQQMAYFPLKNAI
ncbi:MAG: hypothetical protein ABIO05_02840 [Ferruginibacter sp.]